MLVNLIPTTTPTRAKEMAHINAHHHNSRLHNQNPKNSSKSYTDIVLLSNLQPDISAFKISGQIAFHTQSFWKYCRVSVLTSLQHNPTFFTWNFLSYITPHSAKMDHGLAVARSWDILNRGWLRRRFRLTFWWTNSAYSVNERCFQNPIHSYSVTFTTFPTHL